MRSYLLKIIAAFLAFFLLSCVGVNVALRMSPVMAAFLIGALLVVFFACLLLVILGRRRPVQTEEPPPQEPVDPLEEEKRRLAGQYDALLAEFSVPADAAVIHLPSALFASGIAGILHYIWRTESELLLFPRWDSLESCMQLSEYPEGTGPYQISLYPLRIPLERVHYYTRITQMPDANTFTLLYYQDAFQEDMGLLLRKEAYSVLEALLPDRDLQDLQKHEYPSSARQILDITVQMQQLKELYTGELIDEQEYHLKKAELLKKL